VAIFGVAAFGSGDIGGQAALALTLFVGLGLPHGALDHRVGTEELRWSPQLFYVAYLAAGLAMAAAWYLLPLASATLFLVLSAWHFGEADVRSLPVQPGWRPALNLARGGLVVGLLAASWPAEVASLLGPWAPVSVTLPRTVALPLVLWTFNVGLMLVAVPRTHRKRVAYAALDAALVAAWLWTAEPLLAFVGYFTAWHSFDHLRLLGARFRLAPSALAAAVVPYTVLATAGGAAIAWIGLGLFSATFAAAALGAVSAVATPHLVLVEIWRSTFSTPSRPPA
jgi:Brp/Blh family beta-carotene 15,15'-monooxygenase